MTLCALVTAWASYTLHHDSLTLCDWHHDYSGPLPCCEVWMENCCCNVVFYYVLGPRCSITIDALFQCYFYFSYFVYTIFLISIFVFVFSINSPVFSCCVFGIKCEKKHYTLYGYRWTYIFILMCWSLKNTALSNDKHAIYFGLMKVECNTSFHLLYKRIMREWLGKWCVRGCVSFWRGSAIWQRDVSCEATF